MLATAEYSGKTGRHFAESNALRGRFHLLSVSWNEVDPCQSHFTQRSALLFAFILVTYRSEDLMLSLNAYRTAILRYRPLSVVLACSLKLIWCCLVPSVCSDSDEGYYIPPTQLPCLVVQNGSLGMDILLESLTKKRKQKAYFRKEVQVAQLVLQLMNEKNVRPEVDERFTVSGSIRQSHPEGANESLNSNESGLFLFDSSKSTIESIKLGRLLPPPQEDFLLSLAWLAGPPSSLRSNPSRQLWQPVLIALALIPVRGASARGKIAQTYIQGKDLRILYKKGKISKSRLGTSNRRIRKEERRVEKKGNGILHKGRERKGDSTKKSEKGSKEGTHLDRATTGDRIWKRDQHVFSNEQIYTVNDSAPREQRTITAKASTNAAAYETHPGESYTVRREPLSL
ncbi:hypothetical protein L1987_89123 [Smallanthus sonchifolius]|nr:hypothetical protein L1987_89123 [Smallanthus sonchifolius]